MALALETGLRLLARHWSHVPGRAVCRIKPGRRHGVGVQGWAASAVLACSRSLYPLSALGPRKGLSEEQSEGWVRTSPSAPGPAASSATARLHRAASRIQPAREHWAKPRGRGGRSGAVAEAASGFLAARRPGVAPVTSVLEAAGSAASGARSDPRRHPKPPTPTRVAPPGPFHPARSQ